MGGGRGRAGHHLTQRVEHYDIEAGDELRLHVVKSGEGPVLLLLHGFTGSADSWQPLRELLDKEFTVVAVDLPGHGRSSSSGEPSRYSVERFVHDLETVCEELHLERVILMGYSMGGRLALRFALAHPERLAALILESTSPGIADPATRQNRLKSDAALAQSIEQNGVEDFVNRWESLSLWESQRALPHAQRAGLRVQRLTNNATGLANSLRGAGPGTMDVLSNSELRSIRVPTLLVAGALDTAYVSHADSMQRSMRSAHTNIIEGAGHAVHFEKPDELAAAVRRFLLDSDLE